LAWGCVGAVVGTGGLLALVLLYGGLPEWLTSASDPGQAELPLCRPLLCNMVALPVLWYLTGLVGGLVLGTGRKLAAALDITVAVEVLRCVTSSRVWYRFKSASRSCSMASRLFKALVGSPSKNACDFRRRHSRLASLSATRGYTRMDVAGVLPLRAINQPIRAPKPAIPTRLPRGLPPGDQVSHRIGGSVPQWL